MATTLLGSGLGHVVRVSEFRALGREPGLLSPRWALPAAAGVTAYELVGGGLAAALLVLPRPTALAATVFASCALAGCAFWLYVRHLLDRPGRVASCGCSPISSPLTPASM